MTVMEPAPTSVDATVNQSAIWHLWEFTYGFFLTKLLIVAPVSVSQSQMNCARKSWLRENRVHSMEISNGYKRTCIFTWTHRWGVEWLLFVWKMKAEAIRVHFSGWGLLPYLEQSEPILATVTGALGRLGGVGLRGGGGHSGNQSKWQTVQSVHGSLVSTQHGSSLQHENSEKKRLTTKDQPQKDSVVLL